MDQLEALKKEWQSREQVFPKFTAEQIYPMLLKKSSSIVKWIVIISICEIAFWTLLTFLIPDSINEFNNEMGLKTIYTVLNIISYTVVAVFIYLFYRNYVKIQVTSTVKELMGNILRTRKTVRYFVYYNIGMAALLMIGINIYYYFNKEKLYELFAQDELPGVPPEAFFSSFFIGQFVAGVICLGLLMLFYWLLYGLLMKRLKRNYNELKKIEV
ncbi:hypothetical protein POV27_05720 [Aureisphaera galaxeae]|uniref:hypothetical protein n=1 Tax=Aureisphaera galaxeae TaxID=1538023 RepID=UPI0023505E79|nr:hypothetical protein [Aureisphaera galaxeae]MDC8003539.1 hypothetical protein [Aureisphaera galaxeae]